MTVRLVEHPDLALNRETLEKWIFEWTIVSKKSSPKDADSMHRNIQLIHFGKNLVRGWEWRRRMLLSVIDDESA